MQATISQKKIDSERTPGQNLVDHNAWIMNIRHKMEECIGEIGNDGIEDPYTAFVFGKYLKRLRLKIQEKYGDILDIWAWNWEFAYFAKKYATFPDTSIKSIDISPHFVQKGKARWIDIEVMDATSLTFPDETFDMLLSQYSMPQCLFPFDQERYDRGEKQIEDPKGEKKVSQWLHESLRILKKWWELRFSTISAKDKDYRWALIKWVLDKFSSEFFTYSEFPNWAWETTYILKKSK